MGFWRDLRVAVRALLRNRPFMVAAVLTVAVGVGSTSTVAAVVDSIVWRPLPYAGSERIVQVLSHRREGAATIRSPSMARPFIEGLRERSRSFAEIGVVDSFSNVTRRRLAMAVGGRFGTTEVYGTRISPTLFSMLGAQARLGRLFGPGDDRPERNRLIILSDRAWRVHYASDPGVLGTSLTIDGRPYTLVGVMAPQISFPDLQTDFWIPLTLAPVPPPSEPRSDSPASAYADAVFARLGDGVRIEGAAVETDALLRQLSLERAAETGLTPEQSGFPPSLVRRADVVSLKEETIAPVRPLLSMLSLSALLLVLMAAANLTTLFWERARSAERSIAVRRAFGATREQMLRPFWMEGAVLAIGGGLIGLALAYGLVRLTAIVVPLGVPRADEIALHWPVLVVALGAATAAGTALSAVSAWRVTRGPDMSATLRTRTRVSSVFRGLDVRAVVVAGQVAVAVVLCVSAGLLVRSFVTLLHLDPGYDARDVTTFQMSWPSGRVSDPTRLYTEVLSRLEADPAIQSAGATDVLPIAGASTFHMSIGGLPVAPGAEPMSMHIVTRGYFDTMRMRFVRGRSFSEAGTAPRPEIILNEEFVRRYFAGTDPLGQVVGDTSRYEVVGVVNDVVRAGRTADVRAEYYVDLSSFGLTEAAQPYFTVRSAADSAALGSRIRSIVRGVDAELGVAIDQQGLAELLSDSVETPRFNTFVLTTFAVVALLLALIGVYGVVAHAVTTQTREIGIRMALGATPSRVRRMVLTRSLTVTMLGAAAGLVGAALVSGYLDSMLFEVSPLDAVTFAVVGGLFLLVALLAAFFPAARASRIDPIIALQHD